MSEMEKNNEKEKNKLRKGAERLKMSETTKGKEKDKEKLR